jgi:recombination protein RecT
MNARAPRPPRTSESKAVARQSDAEAWQAIRDEMTKRETEIVAALSPLIDPERFLTLAGQAIRSTPALFECSPVSIVLSLREAGSLGLIPGRMGECYLVPYFNSKTGRKEAQFIPGYRGLIELAKRTGTVVDIEARVVRQNDEYDFAYGARVIDGMVTNGTVRHRPMIDGDPGPYRAVWFSAVTVGPNGVIHQRLSEMSWAEIEAVRRRSKAADSGPWVTDPGEMGKKTIVKREVKYLRLSPDVERALEAEDRAEANAVAPTAARRIDAGTARGRLLARAGFDEKPENAPHAPEEPEVEADSTPEPVEAPVPETPAHEPEVRGPVKMCGSQSPYGDEHACDREPGHDGSHQYHGLSGKVVESW